MISRSLGKFAKTGFIVLLSLIGVFTILAIYNQNLIRPPGQHFKGYGYYIEENTLPPFNVSENSNGKWRQLPQKQLDSFSKLGRILFLDDPIPEATHTKNYTILVWKYGHTTHDRHMKRYTDKEHDPFEFCSVRNCKVTYESSELPKADLVIMHLHRTVNVKDLPPSKDRRQDQIWAFSTDESPYHTFLSRKGNAMADYNGIFNWSMTYRMDADIPVPYGRTVLKPSKNLDYKFDMFKWLMSKKHDVLIAIMGSNCGSQNHRWEYVKELNKHISVDTYGGCGKLKCAGHFTRDCPSINDYMFYLAFENSNCDEYITEKLWWNAYAKNSIPIVMGSKKINYKNLLPPHSFIDVEDFASPRDLAAYINYLVNTSSELQKYFHWKKYFQVLNEHGYFQTVSYHYCRACEALNYNSKEFKVYNNLTSIWSVQGNCYPAWDKIYD